MAREFIPFVKQLFGLSAPIIMGYFRGQIVVESKADGSPVTIADKKAEEALREMILREMPEHGIIGEEFSEHYKPFAPYQWTLDPIDGTRNFATGSYLFGTQVSLLLNGKPTLGAIHLPVTGDLLIGVEGEALLNDNPVHVRPCASIDEAVVLSSAHWEIAKYHRMPGYEQLTKYARMYRTWGDCHGYYLVATGFADANLDAKMEIWDYMPLIPIIEGAGGTITDWYGNNAIGGQGIVATGGTIHDSVIRMLNHT